MNNKFTDRRKGYSTKFIKRLVLTLLALGVCLAIGWQVSNSTESQYNTSISNHVKNKLDIYLSFLENELSKYKLLVKILSEQSNVRSPLVNKKKQKDNKLDRDLNLYLENFNKVIKSSFSFVMNMEGDVVASSNWKNKKSFVGRYYGFRPYFKKAIRGKITNYLAFGATTGVPGLFYSSPIYNTKKAVVGVAVIKFSLKALSPNWHSNDDNLYITDENDVIFITNRDKYKFYSMGNNKKIDEINKKPKGTKKYAGKTIKPMPILSKEKNNNNMIIKLSEDNTTHTYFTSDSNLKGFNWLVHVYAKYDDLMHRRVINISLAILIFLTTILLGMYVHQRKTFMQRMYDNAIKDPLTKLYTRLYMHEKCDVMLDKAFKKKTKDLSLALFDIDHFKSINDTHGHNIGDIALAKVAEVINESVREQDLPVRYGGEEFLILLEANIEQAKIVAERVRKKVEDLIIKFDDKELKLTISCGIALYKDSESIDELISRADTHLYKAKDGGRNQVRS